MVSRRTELPFDHLSAELASIPVASRRSLSLAMTELHPSLTGGTGELWRYTEAKMLRTNPGMVVDELVHHRDWLWFSTRDTNTKRREPLRGKSVSLRAYMKSLAFDLLEVSERGAFPAHPSRDYWATEHGPTNEVRARSAWRWFSFSMPADLILAAHPGRPDFVRTISNQMERWLAEGGFAETHAHLGACLDFSCFWVILLRRLARLGGVEDEFASPNAQLEEGRDLARWFLMAGLCRLVLQVFLHKYRAGRCSARTLKELLDEEGGLTIFLGRAGWHDLENLQLVLRCLETGQLGREHMSFGSLEHLFRLMNLDSEKPEPSTRLEVLESDPLARWNVGLVNADVSADHQFMRDVFFVLDREEREGRLSSVGAPDEYMSLARFERLFWQYQRIRGLAYRHFVQRPLTPGLQWFVRFYERLRRGKRGVSDEMLLDSALFLAGAGKGLRSLEIRTAPSSRAQDNLTLFSTVLKKANSAEGHGNNGTLEIGLVLHFVRDRGGNWGRGKPGAHGASTEADVSCPNNSRPWRFGQSRLKFENEATAVLTALQRRPELIRALRGVDVCTDEYGVPTWVVAPVFRRLRTTARSLTFRTEDTDTPLPPLGATVHAGEDFIHLLGGLRRISEAIEHFELGEGDRLGHALALGISPIAWAESCGRVVLTTEERLMDLAWELRHARSGGACASPGRPAKLDHDVSSLASKMFDADVTTWEFLKMVDLLNSQEGQRLVGYPNPAGPTSAGFHDRKKPPYELTRTESRSETRTIALLIDFLNDPGVYRRGQQLEYVDPRDDIESLDLLQKELFRQVQARGLVIEVNPTSNLLVGNLGDMKEHPLWTLKPPTGRGLSLCVGSDDPVIFATDLRREYQLLYDALVGSGASSSEAWTWLDDVRTAGLRSRFTRSFTRPP